MTARKSKKNEPPQLAREFLISGGDYLASRSDFHLVARDAELAEISKILMRRDGHNLIMTGASGVGATALILGLEESKSSMATPYDISGKKFFWLDTDGLFSSADIAEVQKNFQKVLDTLARNSDSVLIIQNAREFIEAAKNRGCLNFINALMGDLWSNKFQAILECRDSQLAEILSSHPYTRQIFTVREIKEPEAASLGIIVTEASKQLENFHGIRISAGAIEAAIKLMEQFHIPQLEYAQPGRTLMLLDSALTSYRHLAHAHGPATEAVGFGDELKAQFLEKAEKPKYSWSDMQARIREVQGEQRAAESLLNSYRQTGASDAPGALKKSLDRIKDEFVHLNKQINGQLLLTAEHVNAEFSRISHLPVSTLDSDETQKLLEMEEALSAGIYGQEEPVKGVTNAVRSGRLGLKGDDEPIASFIFLGPSGTGKTALAEHLAHHLFQDKSALQRYDMSEFSGEGAVEKFIEALTENMRRRPYCVNIFDEMEKADKKIFDLFLQINDKGRLTNSAGLVASFANSINIVTSNIGQEYFYDEKLSFAEASAKAKEDLANTEKTGYRNEVLNRFTGIYSFKTLEAEQLVRVAKRQFNDLGKRLHEKGLALLSPTDNELLELCQDHYIRRKGARSIQKYLRENIAGDISLMMLQNPGARGTIRTSYDRAAKKIRSTFEPGSPAVDPKPAKKSAAPARNKHKGNDELHPSFPGA